MQRTVMEHPQKGPAMPQPRRRQRLSAAQRRTAMPPQLRLVTDIGTGVLAAVAGTFIAHGPGGLEWPLALAVGAAAAVAAVGWRIVPGLVQTGIVLLAWIIVVPLVTWLYIAVTPQIGLDPTGRIAALGLYGVLVAVLAHRTSRGRPWLTTALALLATIAVAFVAFQLSWAGGVWYSYAAGAAMIILRAGVGAWIRDTIDLASDWRRQRKDHRVAVARWNDHAAEATTATLLDDLSGCAVLHDRLIPGSVDDAATLDHLVIAPNGVWVVGSLTLTAPVTTRPDGSVWSGKRNLDRALRECWWQGCVVESQLDRPTRSILAVHGTDGPDPAVTVAMFDRTQDTDQPLNGTVIISGSAALTSIITDSDTGETLGAGAIRRLSRRLTQAFPAGRLVSPSSAETRAAVAAMWPGDAEPAMLPAPTETAPPAAPADHPAPADSPPADDEPATGPIPAATLPTDTDPTPAAEPAPEVPALPEHREYQWDQGDDADELARFGLAQIADSPLSPGDRVNALREDGMLIDWVVISEPYIHADGMAVVDIADSRDVAAAGDLAQVKHFLAEPLDNIDPINAADDH